MKILLVEDDPIQAEFFDNALKQRFPDADVERVKTESEFRARLDAIAQDPPDVVVLDVMLSWTEPSPQMPEPPEEVLRNGFYRAGLRCVALLAQLEKTRGIPIVLYTVLEREDLQRDLAELPRHVSYLRKERSLDALVERIQDVIAAG